LCLQKNYVTGRLIKHERVVIEIFRFTEEEEEEEEEEAVL